MAPGVVASILVIGLATSIAGPAHGRTDEARHAPESARMVDGKLWTTQNLAVRTPGSFCYDDLESNCARFGRLYTWKAARRACLNLGRGWRLAGDSDWTRLARHYGGWLAASTDGGTGAYAALMTGGKSGFNAVLGGGRDPDGRFARGNAHGFYWTATRSGPGEAWLYNFGSGARLLNRHSGETSIAYAVRCIRD